MQSALYDQMKETDIDDFDIELVEEYPFENIEQMNRREDTMYESILQLTIKQKGGHSKTMIMIQQNYRKIGIMNTPPTLNSEVGAWTLNFKSRPQLQA